MSDFVRRGSVVRRVWGDPDMILLVFAGAAAEFALNRAVDWLFFTNRLPRDPLGRLFSTVSYAQGIVFADEQEARATFERINRAHAGVEQARGDKIPAWAHRDVLYMLVDYTQRAFHLLDRQPTLAERAEMYDVFRRTGEGLRIPDLPGTYDGWRADRRLQLARDLARSDYTDRLYAAYREHLGAWRYELLLRVQAALVPAAVGEMLNLRRLAGRDLVSDALWVYSLIGAPALRSLARAALVPPRHLEDVRRLERR